MACNCIEETNKLLAEQGMNTRLQTMTLFNDSGIRQTVFLGTEVVEKKRGARPKSFIPTFCPFCGVAYEKESA